MVKFGFNPQIHTRVKMFVCYAGIKGGIAHSLTFDPMLDGTQVSAYTDLISQYPISGGWEAKNWWFGRSHDVPNPMKETWNTYIEGELTRKSGVYD